MDATAILIGGTITNYDSFGNPVKSRAQTEVLCDLRTVTRSEFYSAAHNGLQPSLTLWISNSADYNGENLVRIGGDLFSVIRSYRAPGSDAIELTLQAEIGNRKEDESDG